LPGPGNYDHDSNTQAFGKSGIAASIRGRGNDQRPSGHPGPGAYEENHSITRDKSATVKIGSSRRQEMVSRGI
jgi:hypothetical protein